MIRDTASTTAFNEAFPTAPSPMIVVFVLLPPLDVAMVADLILLALPWAILRGSFLSSGRSLIRKKKLWGAGSNLVALSLI
jgi:hypothetical protein